MSGRINSIWLAFLASVVVLAGLVAMLVWPSRQERSKAGIVVYCAAGIKEPVMAAARDYEKAYGVPIQLTFAGSNTLLAQAKASQSGDLYLPADESYIDLAREQKLIDEVLPVAIQRPVLAVKTDNPKSIQSLADILKPGIKISQANPDAAAIGKIIRTTLTQSRQWDAIQAHRAVMKETVNEVATDIAVGTVDAGFVWDSTVHQMSKRLKAIEIPAFKDVRSVISIAVLGSTKQPTEALRFARFLAARDKGLAHFTQSGYEPVAGDEWEEEPSLQLYAGAMLRPAIAPTLAEFELREGVKITCHFNGCGILVGEMKANPISADAYFACDRSFMDKVTDLFGKPLDISSNQLVILVARHNPKQIKTVQDLARPGLRLGLARPEYSALGAIVKNLLVREGCYDAVAKNVVVESATGDALVNQFRTNSLDAVIVYRSNADASKEKLDIVHIGPSAIAVQPFAIAKTSKHKYLAGRLLDAFSSPQSRQRFEALGFQWVRPDQQQAK